MTVTMAERPGLVARINTLYDRGEFEAVLACLGQLIELDGETERILDYQYDLLMRLGNHQDARAVALKLEGLSARKSPWNCLKIAEACLGMGQTDEAFAWLEKAIAERNFKRGDVFADAPYDLIREDHRFLRLVEKARDNIGLDRPAQDFRVRLLDGSECLLSALQGQVVLIDFWSTDCLPCVREMPFLKSLYSEFKEQGFEIIGISLDTSKPEAEKYISENGIAWKICCSGEGFQDEIADRFKIEATPSTWLVDRRGVLRFYQVKGQALKDAVQQLLGEQSGELKCRGEHCTL